MYLHSLAMAAEGLSGLFDCTCVTHVRSCYVIMCKHVLSLYKQLCFKHLVLLYVYEYFLYALALPHSTWPDAMLGAYHYTRPGLLQIGDENEAVMSTLTATSAEGGEEPPAAAVVVSAPPTV